MSRSPRFLSRRFLCPALPDRGPVRLAPEESRHLAGSMRAQPGDELELVDGRGKRARAKFVSIAGGMALVEVLSAESGEREGAKVTLVAAIPKGPRADWMVEKATEAGLDILIPILTKRGVAKAEGEAKRARWERLATAAAKQCGRSTVPELLAPKSLEEALEVTSDYAVRCLADSEGNPASGLPKGDAAIFVGPEGGWDPIELLKLKTLKRVRLGPFTLRVETAALLGVAALAAR